MINNLTWYDEIKMRYDEAQVKEKEARNLSKQAEVDADRWKEITETLGKLLQLYGNDKPVNLQNQFYERLRSQSTWDSLKDIMKANNSDLVVINAISTLVEAGVFEDRERARNSIYSTLYNHRRDVKRVKKGVYKLWEHPESFTKVKLNNPISFPKAVAKIIKEGAGRPLTSGEIWTRMQAMGVSSIAKDPVGWVGFMARKMPEVEKVSPNTWRWKTSDNNAQSLLALIPSTNQ
ncbi:MAG: hypothetical protein HYX83_00495 [Chloroflexi bacterium]|nr:hypothetical protein [Chloroflexota bacterium]